MTETAAQYLDRRGAQRGRKEANLAAAKRYLFRFRNLETRFGDIPDDVRHIQNSKDAVLLDH